MKNKAFTLIELLVVIAIIGILATVVIASLNSARNKSRIAAIKSNLRNLQTQSHMYFNDTGTYVGLCTYNATGVTAHASIQPMIDALTNIAGSNNVRCVVRTSNVPATSHYFPEDSLETKNFGVAVYFNETHYGVDATSVMTLDATNTGDVASWQDAMNRCASNGKRLPNIEVFKAINDYGAFGGNLGFIAGYFWSSTASSSSSTFAYHQYFSNGSLSRGGIANTALVRCAS